MEDGWDEEEEFLFSDHTFKDSLDLDSDIDISELPL